MAGRYLITGVQLGILVGSDDIDKREELVREIERRQYIGNSRKLIEVDVKEVQALHHFK